MADIFLPDTLKVVTSYGALTSPVYRLGDAFIVLKPRVASYEADRPREGDSGLRLLASSHLLPEALSFSC